MNMSRAPENQAVKKADKLINKLSDLPKFDQLLTGGRGTNHFALPEAVLNHLCVIEVGAKRAVMLYNPSHVNLIQAYINQIRGHLITAGYTVVKPDLPCESDLIAQIAKSVELDGGAEGQGGSKLLITPSESRQLFDSWVEIAVRERATDIHIQTINNRGEVKLRIDGELHAVPDIHAGVYPAIQVERAVAWAYNNASGKGANSDSQFTASENQYTMIATREVLGKKLTLRYQGLRGWAGIKVVCRLLFVDADAPTLSYEQLGYAQSQIDLLTEAAYCQSGMVIFAGVTGSGKTTTLKTFMETHPSNGADAFYSIEDPVEYPLRGVHQIPVQRDLLDKAGSARKYGEVVAALMRADPGVVMMGEIRDSATALSAQQVVETGHTACGTVHAHLISGIVPRLTNEEVGMSRDVLTNPNILSLLVYQALVPVLCTNCCIGGAEALKRSPDDKQLPRMFKALESRFRIDANQLKFKNPTGCPHCNHRGVNGLTVVAEILTPESEWLRLIKAGDDRAALDFYRSFSDGQFDSPNMQGKTVFEHTLYKAIKGIVDPRHCERFGSFNRFELSSASAVLVGRKS